MPLQLQTRLLRVIQEGRLRRVGDESPIEVDVRVVAATHRDLKREVAEGRFREDLFYRLNVFTVRLPALRDRIGDLEPLVQHFLRRQGRELGVAEWEVAPEVLAALAAHPWPGNVRELANLCAALAVRGRQDGAIGLDELAAVWRRQHPGETPPWTGAPSVARDHLGGWVLEQARAARFNLVEAARQLARRKQRGQAVPLTERSALTYYLTGEILRALAECEGDEAGAARQLAGDDDLAARIAARVRKVADVVREARGDARGLKRTFAKLPAGYEAALEDAAAAMRGR
jgi:DNA-binding NtrC family response regulator